MDAQEWASKIETNLIVSKINVPITKNETYPKETSDGDITLLEQTFDQTSVQIRQTQGVLFNKVDNLENDKVHNFPYDQECSTWECPNALDHMNLVEEVDPIYTIPSQTILTIIKEQWELENAKVDRVA